MADPNELITILDRILAGDRTEADITKLRQHLSVSSAQNTVQLGKYNVKIEQGQDIQIGDTIYKGADAETIRELLQDVLYQLLPDKLEPPAQVCRYPHTLDDIKPNWCAWKKTIRGKYISDLGYPKFLVTSPLESYWKNFINELDWHEKLSNYLTEISKGLEKILDKLKLEESKILYEDADLPSQISSFLQQFKKIDYQVSYETIIASNLNKLVDDALSQINRFISDTKLRITKLRIENLEEGISSSNSVSQHLQQLVQSAEGVRHDLHKVDKHIDSPFRRCFLVLGSPGSGKTHFLASLLAESEDLNKELLVLPLIEPYIQKTLEEVILDSINHATKVSWPNLKSFNSFLERSNDIHDLQKKSNRIKLIISIDNLQTWLSIRGNTFNQELISFIRKSTELHSIFWLITLRDASYDKLLNDKHEQFWRKYSCFDSTEAIVNRAKNTWNKSRNFYFKSIEENVPNIGGWAVLDTLNIQNQLGIGIIKKAIVTEKETNKENDLVALNWIDEQKKLIEKLSNPFIALILLDLSEFIPLKNLVNLNFIEFVEYFWMKYRPGIDFYKLSSLPSVEVGEQADLANEAIKFIADFIIYSGEVNLLYTKLVNRITEAAVDISELQNRELTKAVINDLEQNSLLKRVENNIEIKLEFFWEYEIAKRIKQNEGLTNKDFIKSFLQLEKWFTSFKHETMREGVLEFFLLLLDQDVLNSNLSPEFVKGLWHLILTSKNLPSTVGWFAASKASEQIQSGLVEFALAPSSNFIDSRTKTLFSFMHFVSNASTSIVNESVRLRLLQPYYCFIRKYSLSAYYLYIVESLIIGLKDNKILCECMIQFSGCEVLEITQELAWLTINSLARNTEVNLELMLQVIFNYLRKSSRQAKSRGKRTNKQAVWSRYSYREWILCELCRYIVEFKRKDTFQFLEEHHWYEPERLLVSKTVGVEMQREANLAIGYSYRSQWSSDEQRSLVNVIDTLVDSKSTKNREIAFYLMKHTEFIQDEKVVTLNKDFRPFLEKIFLDPKLDLLIKRHYEIFKRNIENFEKLERRRQTILKRSKYLWY